jgi:hypothetical protein
MLVFVGTASLLIGCGIPASEGDFVGERTLHGPQEEDERGTSDLERVNGGTAHSWGAWIYSALGILAVGIVTVAPAGRAQGRGCFRRPSATSAG